MEVRVGWASETGNTIDLLRQFLTHCQKLKIRVTSVQQLGKEIELLSGIWVFFVSTTGQGDPPHQMRPFWKRLMAKNYHLQKPFSFAVYSLGDVSYGDHFGMAARKLRQRLKMLGGQEFAEIGLGDDMDPKGCRQVYLESWRDRVTAFLQEHTVPIMEQLQQIPHLSLRHLHEEIEFQVESIEELSSHKGRRTYWAQLRVFGGEAKEGDVAEIFPHNRHEDVQFLLEHWGKQGSEKVEWHGKEISLMQLLTEHANISSTLNYFFFTSPRCVQLALAAPSPMLQQKVTEFGCSFEEYFNYIRKYRRNITDFMRDFELKLDYGYFLAHINEVVGRKYSIAKVDGNRIYLLIKLVEQNITEARLHKGLCSHDLFRSQGSRRKGKLLQGDFLPEEMKPVNLLVTLGTGIAPFIWILEQQARRGWKCMLVYTNSFADQMHHRHLLSLKEGEGYSELVSVTREGGPKMLRLLEAEAARIGDFISKGKTLDGVRVLYCGPKEVHQYLMGFISQLIGISVADLTKRKVIVHQNW